MYEFVSVIICFVVAISTLFLLKPYAERITVRILSEHRMRSRLLKTSSESDDDREDDRIKDIGLSGKELSFNSAILNYIAAANKELIAEMQELLLQAGIHHESALEELLKSKLFSCIALTFITLLALILSEWHLPIWFMVVVSIAIGAYGGHRLINLNMQMIANARKDSIEYGVPDLVDLLVICAESGLDLNRSIQRIAREMRTSNPTLADELSLTSIELEMIPDHRVAFDNLTTRTNSLQIKTIAKTLSQSIEYGSSLATSLRELAVESRQRRMLSAEAKAAKIPTLLTLPMMFFIMPCLFIVMLGPVVLDVMQSFSGM